MISLAHEDLVVVGRIPWRLFDQRVEDTVRRVVAVADAHECGCHLVDEPIAQGVALSLVRRLEQVGSGVAGDRLGFGAYRVREGRLPDLVSDVVGRRPCR
jgi:hypothetical protein